MPDEVQSKSDEVQPKLEEVQPELYAQFSRLLKNKRLSHAYLFAGGFASDQMALWLTQAIFCENPHGGLPDQTCRACKLVGAGEFIDLHIIEPDGMTIKTEQIRSLLAVFSQSGYESARKVVLIREAEKMHPTAANSLLKSIEEPESDLTLILLTANENLILDTIRSRTQLVRFPRNDRYLRGLLERQGILPTEAELVAALADSEEEAQELAHSTWFVEGAKKARRFVELAQAAPDEGFLYIPNLIEIFSEKRQQEMAFELLLQLFNSEKLTTLTQRTFLAQRYWRSNVRFQSALETLLL